MVESARYVDVCNEKSRYSKTPHITPQTPLIVMMINWLRNWFFDIVLWYDFTACSPKKEYDVARFKNLVRRAEGPNYELLHRRSILFEKRICVTN